MLIPIDKDVKEKFNKVIQYSQYGIKDPKTDTLFSTWATSKAKFYKLFGQKCIWEYPEKVTFELDSDTKQERISDLILYILSHEYSDELADFLNQQKSGFFDNKVVEEYVTKSNEIITKNTKLIKAFKYFIGDKEVLNDLQSRASRIIQENKIEGRLCFSIHPLDYLSISETTHNWRSCHALDGEYRAGNLSYMMDNSTVICYLKSEQEAVLPHFPEDVPWNNKKWRVLLYFNETMDLCFAGRQYPFSTSQGMNWILKNCFNKLFMDSLYFLTPSAGWGEWSDKTIDSIDLNGYHFDYSGEGIIPLDDGVKAIREIVKDADGSKQFNDVLRSSIYKPMYSHLNYRGVFENKKYIYTNTRTAHIVVGHKTPCLCCGEREVLDENSTMMCYDCEYKFGDSNNDLFCNCDYCGDRMKTDDGYFSADGNIYCPSCWTTRVVECVCCGDELEKDNMVYDEDFEEWYCSDCYRGRH